jgi:hypothetical protein
MAVSRWIEQATGWSIYKFVKTADRRTITIRAGAQVLTAADPQPTTCVKPWTASRPGGRTAEHHTQ